MFEHSQGGKDIVPNEPQTADARQSEDDVEQAARLLIDRCQVRLHLEDWGRLKCVSFGDLIVLGTLLTGVGAILITYYGLSEFQPEALED